MTKDTEAQPLDLDKLEAEVRNSPLSLSADMSRETALALIAQARAARPALLSIADLQATDRYQEIARRIFAAGVNKWNDVFQIEMRELLEFTGYFARQGAADTTASASGEVAHDIAAAFLRNHDGLNVIKEGTVGYSVVVSALQAALYRAPVAARQAAAKAPVLYVRRADIDGTMPGSTVVASKVATEEWTVPFCIAAKAPATLPHAGEAAQVRRFSYMEAEWRDSNGEERHTGWLKDDPEGPYLHIEDAERFVASIASASVSSPPEASQQAEAASCPKCDGLGYLVELAYPGQHPDDSKCFDCDGTGDVRQAAAVAAPSEIIYLQTFIGGHCDFISQQEYDEAGGDSNADLMKLYRSVPTAGAATTSEDAREMPHGHREDYYLMANARRLAEQPIHAIKNTPNWHFAAQLFATGSNSSYQICADAGIDPYGYTVERATQQEGE